MFFRRNFRGFVYFIIFLFKIHKYLYLYAIREKYNVCKFDTFKSSLITNLFAILPSLITTCYFHPTFIYYHLFRNRNAQAILLIDKFEREKQTQFSYTKE